MKVVSLGLIALLYIPLVDEESSSSNLITDDLGIYGRGEYIIRQGVGGSGFGLDLGVVSQPLNGWKFGASLINAVGTIRWTPSEEEANSGINPLAGSFYPFTWGDHQLQPDESIIYTFNIDTIRADKLSNDSLFTNETNFTDTLKNDFESRMPSTFRFGLSKDYGNFLIASDLVPAI